MKNDNVLFYLFEIGRKVTDVAALGSFVPPGISRMIDDEGPL